MTCQTALTLCASHLPVSSARLAVHTRLLTAWTDCTTASPRCLLRCLSYVVEQSTGLQDVHLSVGDLQACREFGADAQVADS